MINTADIIQLIEQAIIYYANKKTAILAAFGNALLLFRIICYILSIYYAYYYRDYTFG